MKNVVCVVLLAVLCVAAAAQLLPTTTAIATAEAVEYERIRQERSAALEEFNARDAQCYQRFAVNDCLAEARKQRRNVLADLRRQEFALNDAQRKRRAADQLLRSDEKAATRP
ncbi:MAG: hypothetical protein LH632_00275 [Rhodoferax sp.]|nr:hypothetical protein [Rhodoferax sp.]